MTDGMTNQNPAAQGIPFGGACSREFRQEGRDQESGDGLGEEEAAVHDGWVGGRR